MPYYLQQLTLRKLRSCAIGNGRLQKINSLKYRTMNNNQMPVTAMLLQKRSPGRNLNKKQLEVFRTGCDGLCIG